MIAIGFKVGKAIPCNFYHSRLDTTCTVHGDGFTSCGPESAIEWLKAKINTTYDSKHDILGPCSKHEKTIRVLNRVLSWSSDGIRYEADQRHADIVISELGLKDSKPVSTPGSKEDVDKMLTGIGEPLGPSEATQYRALAARLNYLALDRPDIQYATKEIARNMATPTEGNWLLMKRMARYLKGCPRLVQMFRWQDPSFDLSTYTDSDWAGDKISRKSTSGGIAFRGTHCIKSWSSNQTIIALSSAEAELYALLKGACQTLGLKSMAADLGDEVQAGLWSDASAAIAISQRSGLGKLRRIQTQFLWLQERVSAKELKLTKVLGTSNPADMLTKHLARPDLDRHLEFSGLIICAGRADGSLHVSGVSRPTACSYVGSLVKAAIRHAAGSFQRMSSSKESWCPLRPKGVHDSNSEQSSCGSAQFSRVLSLPGFCLTLVGIESMMRW